MARPKPTWRQAELKLSVGGELWVIVRHRRGSFRLPVTATVEQLLWGIADGWTFDTASHKRPSDPLRPDARALVRLWEKENGAEGAPPPAEHGDILSGRQAGYRLPPG